jgi:glycine cleavage system regulatory protein
MQTDAFLVLTVIGEDRPGLVGELSAVIAAHQGNWLESSMSHLAGKFAGILKVAVPAAQADALQAALGRLAALKVVAEAAAQKSVPAGRRLKLTLVGHDRIGIVREVAQILAKHAVNVEKLATHTASAPMSAEILFHCQADLTTPPEFDPRALKADLEKLSDELMVDIGLEQRL